ncbi:MAG TPA: SMC family ATPase [Anaerolineae bacterium]|nr:SMC family ATPase [Anaerolineae bacterium]
MIPLKLTLHNFMCYRDPAPLDFSGMHLVCLSGNNGHGKSAILDAMTWALWGKARSNQADDLIHLGQSDMWVDFEFALGPNRYRVLRSRERKGRSGKSDLQFQIWQDSDDWRAITEPTLRDTEQAIVDLLRMDYDTFINSAFLVQGRADEFTVKPPNQRKQILADILGLSIYDEYESRAKERARQEKQDATRLGAQLETIDAELALESSYQQDLEQAQGLLTEQSEHLRAAEQVQQTLRAERQDLLAQRRMLEDLQGRLKQSERQLAEVETQSQRDQGRLAADQALLVQRAEIDDGLRRLQAARQADQAMNRQLSQQAALQAQRSTLEGQVNQARFQLETQQRTLAERLARLHEDAAQTETLEAQLAQAQAELARLAELDSRQAELRQLVQELQKELAGLQVQNDGLRAEMDDLKEKMALLESADAGCPVCGQPLGDRERQQVLADYAQRGKTHGDQHRANQARIAQIVEQGRAAEADLAGMERELKQRARWQRSEAQTEQRLAQAAQARADLNQAQGQLDQVADQLSAGEYAVDAQAALLAVIDRLQALGYDAAAHEAVRETAIALEPYAERHSQLQLAASRADDLHARIEQAEATRQLLRDGLAADAQRRDELTTALARLPQVEQELSQQAAQVERLERSANEARQRVGAARQKLDACRAQAARRQQLRLELQGVLERQATFEELQAAFGKKGLQAMIIEAAIPEIEAEANQLLFRMTDGRMAVRMETQRETKTTQEVRETLDIILSDELGSRDYSLFSGGEAFRANFAIRIALSKLLARRAGAALQTLIVDEGFGTQDTQGRERLVQAITSIQHDFERILVITHIDELKDLFPARIEVEKTADGSQITVS